MAEYWLGKADGCRSAFGFLINRAGVGGALLVDGEVFRGFRGGAGEVGHTMWIYTVRNVPVGIMDA